MKSKTKEVAKDCAVGVGIGFAVIIPGISAGTIAIITNSFKKIVNAVDGLFSKKFLESLLILLPFAIAGVITVGLLIKPIDAALEICMFGILSLFAGFIAGSIPGLTDEIKGKRVNKINICLLIVGFLVSSIIGVLSILFDFSSSISLLFNERNFLLYVILLIVGIVGSTGLIVPGFSGSALLLILGFYKPILEIGKKLISFDGNFLNQFSLLLVFAIGVFIGFILFSKLMNKMITNHKQNSYFMILGFVIGSLVSIYINSNTFAYINQGNFGVLDKILTPLLFVVGFVLAYLLVCLNRKIIQKEKLH